MTLDEAIRILSDSANRGITTFNQDYKDAQKLRLEALKRIQKSRLVGYHPQQALLPRETQK